VEILIAPEQQQQQQQQHCVFTREAGRNHSLLHKVVIKAAC
jgi:hypothetical protein